MAADIAVPEGQSVDYSQFVSSGNIAQDFRPVIPRLIASVVYHSEYLMKRLPPHHPLFLSPLWLTGRVHQLRPYAYSCINYDPRTKLHASGVPFATTMLIEMRSMGQTFTRGVAEIKERFSDLPKVIVEKIMENLEINGAIPVNVHTMNEQFAQFKDQIFEKLTELSRGGAAASSSSATQAQGVLTEFRTWTWADGTEHWLPEDFVFPLASIYDIWNIWLHGCRTTGIRPFKDIKSKDFYKTTKNKRHYYGAKRVVTFLLDECKKLNLGVGDLVLSRVAFETVYPELLKIAYKGEATNREKYRFDQLKFNTLYNRLRQNTSGAAASPEDASDEDD